MSPRPTCPYCGASVSGEARYCDHCGTPLTQASASSRRRGKETGRIAVWAFILVVLAVFTTGTLGGYRYRAGQWPAVTTMRPIVDDAPNPGLPNVPSNRVDTSAVAQYLRSVVSINVRGERGNKSGSGFITDQNGHVVTAAHVLEGASDCVTVIDDNGKSHAGQVLYRDNNHDVALLRVPTLVSWPHYLPLGSSAGVQRGDSVYVLGSPKGVGNNVPLSAVVSGLGQSMTLENRFYKDLIQVSEAVVLPGTSGGPLVHKSSGQVVGIVAVGSDDPLAWAVSADRVAEPLKLWASLPDGTPCDSEASARTVPVALATITPLSGMHGIYGTDLADGAQLALRDMESALRKVGYEVTLRPYDDEGLPEVARERAGAAAFDPRVVGVVGSLDSKVTRALGEALQSSGLPLVAPTAGDESLTGFGWPHFNRLVASAQRQEQAAARFAKDSLNIRSVFLIDDGTPEAVRQADGFEMAAQVISLTVAGEAQVSQSMAYADVAREIVESKAESVYYAGSSVVAVRLIQALRQENIMLPIIGGESMADPARLDSLRGPGAEHIYFTGLTALPTEQFQRHFESTLGKPTRGYAAYGYDAASVILSALVRYGEKNPARVPTRPELAMLVRETKGHPGWTSWVTFDSTGENPTSWVYMYEWKQGVPVLLKNLK